MNDINNKFEVPSFRLHYVNRLYRDVQDNISLYKASAFTYENKFAPGSSNIYINKSFQLNPFSPISENSINLYENIVLNETQASDKRLWTYLTHVHFWQYMQNTWSIDLTKNKNNLIEFIRDRYFLNTLNIRSLTHNGISRLWWYTHLTIDNSRSDKYELTKILLSLQDIPVSLLERSIGSSLNVRKGVLEFIQENPELKTSKKIQDLLKYLNLAGGVKNLPLLKQGEIKHLLLNVKNQYFT